MNPVTRRLLEDIDDPDLADFALAWDAYEECAVGIFRAGAALPDEARRFEALRLAAAQGLDPWEVPLEPHWKTLDRPPQESPFRTVLAVERPDVAGNWPMMRALPAAREALNLLLLARAVSPDRGA